MTDAQVTTAITNIADGTPNTAAELRALFTELFNRAPKTGTIVIKDVSNAYITANFDGTGLGQNLEAGYAIVNGENGTRNWDDRFPLAYGVTNTTMGAPVGNNTHTLTVDQLPPHDHDIPKATSDADGLAFSPGTNASGFIKTVAKGGGQAFSIKNKSIVTLVTMKL